MPKFVNIIMKEKRNRVQLCWCCGVPLNKCKGEKIPLKGFDVSDFWTRVVNIFGKKGMPSCGLSDAGRLGQDGNAPDVYLGGE